MKRIDLSRHLPPGMEFCEERTFFLSGLVLAWLYSCLFFVRLFSALDSLYGWDTVSHKRVLLSDAVMQDFAELYAGADHGFYLLAFCMTALMLSHYLYHRRGSKSIYVMRRLPNRWEYHRRCLTMPLVGAAVAVAASLLVLLLYFGIYMFITPDICLSGDQWMKIWRK